MIDVQEQLSLDERSQADFIVTLRKRWADVLYPSLKNEYTLAGFSSVNVEQVERDIETLPLYPWFSHVERIQQKMMWRLASSAVSQRATMLKEELAETPVGSIGSLTLNPDLVLPDWYVDTDIHMQPGSFFGHELSGYVYQFGARIVMLRDNDGFKFHKLFARTALTDIPTTSKSPRVLDMGCGFGKSTRPLVDRFPGAEIVGVDLAAPGLKLAHAQAIADGVGIRFLEEDCRFTSLESGSCDIVTGTMLLHEMPAEAIVGAIREGARVLKPGGSMAFLEFNVTGNVFRDATVYQHAERNNEPYFRDLFASDMVKICEEAGLINAKWTPFDERSEGLRRQGGWGDRNEWHFPWCVLSAERAN
jgi:SAM-dependent methyltransferase